MNTNDIISNVCYRMGGTSKRLDLTADDERRIEEITSILAAGAIVRSDMSCEYFNETVVIKGAVIMVDHKVGLVVEAPRGVEVYEVAWGTDAFTVGVSMKERQGSLAKAPNMAGLENRTMARYWLEPGPYDPRYKGQKILGSQRITTNAEKVTETASSVATGIRGFIRSRVTAAF